MQHLSISYLNRNIEDCVISKRLAAWTCLALWLLVSVSFLAFNCRFVSFFFSCASAKKFQFRFNINYSFDFPVLFIIWRFSEWELLGCCIWMFPHTLAWREIATGLPFVRQYHNLYPPKMSIATRVATECYNLMYKFRLIFRISTVRCSAGTSIILTDVLRGFPLYHQIVP
jgi:hypothetical protein